MSRPRLLLVPEFTEVEWTIKPRLDGWAEVASFDLPGVGDEPLPEGDPNLLTRDVVTRRGLEELDRHGWERCFIVADGWGLAAAVLIAQARPQAVQGMALGHAMLSFRTEGERAPQSAELRAALTQLIHQDYEAFIRHGIAQATAGSVDVDLATKMLERFPKELMELGWERITTDDVPIGDILHELDPPLLLAKHEGCLMSTDEGFEDAAAAFPKARTIAVPDAPHVSEEFAEAVREFCTEVAGGAEPRGAHSRARPAG